MGGIEQMARIEKVCIIGSRPCSMKDALKELISEKSTIVLQMSPDESLKQKTEALSKCIEKI